MGASVALYPELVARVAAAGVPYEQWPPMMHEVAEGVVITLRNKPSPDVLEQYRRDLLGRIKTINATGNPALNNARVVLVQWVNERFNNPGWSGGSAGLVLPDGTMVVARPGEASPLQLAAAALAPNVAPVLSAPKVSVRAKDGKTWEEHDVPKPPPASTLIAAPRDVAPVPAPTPQAQVSAPPPPAARDMNAAVREAAPQPMVIYASAPAAAAAGLASKTLIVGAVALVALVLILR